MSAKRPIPDLRVYWSKRERDIKYSWTEYGRKADAHLLHGVLSYARQSLLSSDPPAKTLLEELDARGYDITTLRISIRKKPIHPGGEMT